MRLARTETARQLAFLGGTIALAAVGAAVLIAAVVVFLESAVAALITAHFSLPDASLVVAGPALILGLLILWAATRRMRIRSASLDSRAR